ncbi:MAG TPA: hypothetical protein VE487_14690, partial [Ilumatobacter sp.]|nr:hypothetical protein [Ilumatobacter sp.]
EGLFAADLAFLQDLYGIINFGDQADVEALQASVLPTAPAETEVDVEVDVEPQFVGVSAADEAPGNERPADAPSSRKRARIEEVARVASQ